MLNRLASGAKKFAQYYRPLHRHYAQFVNLFDLYVATKKGVKMAKWYVALALWAIVTIHIYEISVLKDKVEAQHKIIEDLQTAHNPAIMP